VDKTPYQRLMELACGAGYALTQAEFDDIVAALKTRVRTEKTP
jgi:hypothetical protein